jgi:hypothetical protein
MRHTGRYWKIQALGCLGLLMVNCVLASWSVTILSFFPIRPRASYRQCSLGVHAHQSGCCTPRSCPSCAPFNVVFLTVPRSSYTIIFPQGLGSAGTLTTTLLALIAGIPPNDILLATGRAFIRSCPVLTPITDIQSPTSSVEQGRCSESQQRRPKHFSRVSCAGG